MKAALGLAARGLGRVWPNPAVGCILVKDHVVARGWTQPGGRPHAEAEALRRAGAGAAGATAYVTLEPCAHQGATPPCADALIGAGIRRAVVAIEDPDPRVAGQGITALRDAGVEVSTGACAADAGDINAGFLMRLGSGRPLVTLKTATTLDGRIAVRSGESRWITGPAARARAHLMRTQNDAVLVGSGTAITDDPELTCRLPGMAERSPVRIVLDRRLRVPATHRLIATADAVPTWVVTESGHPEARRRALEERGAVLIEVGGRGQSCDLHAVLTELGRRGLTRVLVEGGSELAAAFLAGGLVDRLAWFRGAGVIGGDGIAAAGPLGLDRLDRMPAFRRLSVLEVGDDLLETYALRP